MSYLISFICWVASCFKIDGGLMMTRSAEFYCEQCDEEHTMRMVVSPTGVGFYGKHLHQVYEEIVVEMFGPYSGSFQGEYARADIRRSM